MHIIDILPRIQASHVTKLCYDIFFVKAVVKLRYSLCCICCQFSQSRQYTTDEGIYQTAEAATALHARLVFSLLNPCMGFKEGAFPVCVLIVLGTYMYTVEIVTCSTMPRFFGLSAPRGQKGSRLYRTAFLTQAFFWAVKGKSGCYLCKARDFLNVGMYCNL